MPSSRPLLAVLSLSTALFCAAQTPQPQPSAAQTPSTQSSAPQTSQTPAPPDAAPTTTLTVRSQVVAISAVVLSKSGEPTGGLTRDDFTLRQDGHDEPIRYFTQGSDLPLTLALLVDTSGSQRTFIDDESLASDVFFDSMLTQPDDRAALFQVDARVLQLQPLTSSADTLHLALGRLQTSPKTSGATLLLDAIRAVADGPLASATGRKAMILLTDGGDNGSRTTLPEAIAEAERHNIQIYSVRYSIFDGPTGSFPHPAGADPGIAILQHLSEGTGGRVFTVSPGTSLRSVYARIAEDLRLQYEVGYVPPSDLPPNSYHRLDLRVHDKHLAVQARKGFFVQP